MIISFYDKDFVGLQNNASLLIDKNSFNLVKRPIELNDFSCVCEAFTEDIQPTFLVVKDDIGRKVLYSSLAGIPILNKNNQTEINATDLKTIFSSDVVIQYETYTYVSSVINKIFTEWDSQVNQGNISCRIKYNDGVAELPLSELRLQPTTEKNVYNALDEISAYLNSYDLYIDSEIDLKAKEVIFTIGQTMKVVDDKPAKLQNIKLSEYGIKNYGKWIADINEAQGYYVNENNAWTDGVKWILTSDNKITIDEINRDIYPIKKRIVTSTESIEQANKDALIELLGARYNENLEIPTNNLKVDFETTFDIYLNNGKFYKSLPCGELRYNSKSYNYDKDMNVVIEPYEIQIGYRYVGVDFI